MTPAEACSECFSMNFPMFSLEAFDVSKGDISFERQHSQDSENGEVPQRTFHIEVDRLSELAEGWQMEKCLRQGELSCP